MRRHFPHLYLICLEVFDRRWKAAQYRADCRKYRDAYYESYSTYVHGYLLPWFQSLRESGQLTIGSKLLMTRGRVLEYYGELDQEGKACGYGVI